MEGTQDLYAYEHGFVAGANAILEAITDFIDMPEENWDIFRQEFRMTYATIIKNAEEQLNF